MVVELEKLQGEGGGGGGGGGGEGVDPGQQAVEDHLLQLRPAQQIWRQGGNEEFWSYSSVFCIHPPDLKGIVVYVR